MAKKVIAYKDGSGKLHLNKRDAQISDIGLSYQNIMQILDDYRRVITSTAKKEAIELLYYTTLQKIKKETTNISKITKTLKLDEICNKKSKQEEDLLEQITKSST